MTNCHHLLSHLVVLVTLSLHLMAINCDDICDHLRHDPPDEDDSKLNNQILGIGLTGTRMWLFINNQKNNFYVYEMPASSLDSVNQRLNLAEPELLQNKWQGLYGRSTGSPRFEYAFTMWDNESDYIFMQYDTEISIKGLLYSINNGTFYDVSNDDNGTKLICISSDVNIEVAGGLDCLNSSANESTVSHIPVSHNVTANGIYHLGHPEFIWTICRSEGQVYVVSDNHCKDIVWSIKHSFHANEQFYFFGSDRKVYISNLMDGYSHSLTKIDFKDFFVCYKAPIIETTTMFVSMVARRALLTCIGLLIILALLAWVYMMYRKCRKPEASKPRSGLTSKIKAATSKGKLAGGTARGKHTRKGKDASDESVVKQLEGACFYANIVKKQRVKSISQYQ